MKFIPTTIRQPDGQRIACYLSGDEYYHWLHDKAGHTIVKNARTGRYVYALEVAGGLQPSALVVGRDDPEAHAVPRWFVPGALIRARRAAHDKLLKRRHLADTPPRCPTRGTINNLVIFIRFSDQDEFGEPMSKYEMMFSDSTAGAYSLHNYYKEVSYGQLSVISHFYPQSPDGMVHSYQAQHPRSYYTASLPGGNPDGYQAGQAYTREWALLGEALAAVSSQIPGGLAVDVNNDGFVDNICFVVRGMQTEWSSLLWPHFSSLGTDSSVSINGKIANTYNFHMQEFGLYGTTTGILAHEMFHSMGAPDLYHYGHDGLQPTGEWDLMSYGSLEAPHMGAYMKYKYGHWIDALPEIAEAGRYTLEPLTSPTDNCYKIASPYSSTEFFLLEYRKRMGAFETLGNMGSGLLVYRIDTRPGLMGNDTGPPDEIYIYRPNGTTRFDGDLYDAHFAADVGRTQISDATNPSSFLQDGGPGGLNISNVDSAGSSISFDVSLQPAAFVRLDTPAVYANFEVGSLQTISWQQGQVASVDLGYSTDTGATWRDIATGLTGHGYAWHVPNTPSRRCVLRIRDSADPGYQHTIPFSISDSKAFYPLVFNYDLSQSHCNFNTAVVCRNDTFWVARWNQNYVARFATDGTYIDSLTIRGTAAGLYSMTYDSRRWFYGVPYGSGYGNHMIYKIDPATWSVVDSIATPAFAQACAYDSTADKHRGGLWVALSDLPVTLIDLQGKVLKQIYSHGLDFISGVAVDHASTGGPYLWLFDHGAGWGFPQFIHKYNLAEERMEPTFHEVSVDLGYDNENAAGNLFVSRDVVPGKTLLMGILSQRPDNRLFAYDIGALPSAVSSTAMPVAYALRQNYPNPFNPETTFEYTLPRAGAVILKIYNLRGQEVATVVRGRQAAGTHRITWQARGLASGLYLYRLRAGDFEQARKLVLVR